MTIKCFKVEKLIRDKIPALEELCEELADVLEVIHALSKAKGLTIEQIEQKRLKKREIKGGFENKIYNSSIQIENTNPSISYYLNPTCPLNSGPDLISQLI